MFVWTGPQDGWEFDVGCLDVGHQKDGGLMSMCFEKQNNEMGFKWGSLKCGIIFWNEEWKTVWWWGLKGGELKCSLDDGDLMAGDEQSSF